MATLPSENDNGGDADEARSFCEEIATRLDALQREVPFGRWTLTRMIGDEWVMVHVAGAASPRGDLVPWDQTICSRMTRDLRDTFVPVDYQDGRVSAPVRKAFDVGAYIGVALYGLSGEPLGTLGAVDTRRHQPPRGRRHIGALHRYGRQLVTLIERSRALTHYARAVTHGLLRQRCGGESRWLPPREWRLALKHEDDIRQALALPAAVLAVSIRGGGLVRRPAGAGQAGERIDGVDGVLARLTPDYVGTRVQPSTLLVLLHECDRQRALKLETHVRVLLEEHGLASRCSAVSARFDEPLRKAEAAALRAVG